MPPWGGAPKLKASRMWPNSACGFLLADAEGLEHGGLEVGLVDPDRAAAEFVAVEDDVVGLGAESVASSPASQLLLVLGQRAGEGVVDGGPAAFLLVEGEQRELGDPEEVELARCLRAGSAVVGAGEADAAEDLAGGLPLVGGEEDQVAGFDVELGRAGLRFPRRSCA